MTGTLGLFSLVDLFQLLSASARTGRLAVHHPEGLARIYFDKGRVVYADFGGLVGEEAVFALFKDEQGSFEFQLGLPAPGVTISGSTESLMMEALRRLDEARRGVDRVSDIAIPLFTEGGKASRTLKLDAGQLEVLKVIDGQHTVVEIAELSEQPLEQVKDVIAQLLDAGAVRFAERKLRTARLVVQLSSQPLPAGTVAVDAQICAAWERTLGHAPKQVLCRRPDGRVDAFKLEPRAQIGPYVLVSRDTLFRANLSAGTTLLVKPPMVTS